VKSDEMVREENGKPPRYTERDRLQILRSLEFVGSACVIKNNSELELIQESFQIDKIFSTSSDKMESAYPILRSDGTRTDLVGIRKVEGLPHINRQGDE
jgi:glycerol-3-phosphate cytidylyltransferase-like family protein